MRNRTEALNTVFKCFVNRKEKKKKGDNREKKMKHAMIFSPRNDRNGEYDKKKQQNSDPLLYDLWDKKNLQTDKKNKKQKQRNRKRV